MEPRTGFSRCLFSLLILAAPALTTFSGQSRIDAQARGVNRNYARTSVQNTNINRNVNVNVNAGYYNRWGHPVARTAAVAATAVAVGTVVASLPPQCSAVAAGAVTYQHCGGVYYQPTYRGTTVQYVVVEHP